ncbi:MAG: hypothetical protein KAR06_11935 [Deltaproteobacteria bacterium]|nr:hypothetical protein [Deltaproteobacteria bacterium]
MDKKEIDLTSRVQRFFLSSLSCVIIAWGLYVYGRIAWAVLEDPGWVVYIAFVFMPARLGIPFAVWGVYLGAKGVLKKENMKYNLIGLGIGLVYFIPLAFDIIAVLTRER